MRSLVLSTLGSILAASAFSAGAFAEEPAFPREESNFDFAEQVRENPYVNLYAKRLEVARLQVQREASISENERIKWVRMSGLANQGAVPRIDADAQETAWKVSVKKVAIAKSRVSKSEALLSIAKQRTAAGLAMPVCTDRE